MATRLCPSPPTAPPTLFSAPLSHWHLERRRCSQVKGYAGDDQLEAALTGCDLVIIPAGVPRKPGEKSSPTRWLVHEKL
jgi:malate dehydrogenase